MDEARCEHMCRRVGREIPPEIYVVQKIANRDWFVLPAFDASGSENAVVRSIERAGAPAKTVNGAIGVVTTGATFCAEAVTEIAKQ